VKLRRFYDGKRILVTGGSAGIGLSVAKLAARHGARVCIAARTPERLDAAVREIGHGATYVVMDVCDDGSVNDAVGRSMQALGGLDILINNAGYAHPGYVEALPFSVYSEMLDVNYLGMVRVIRATLDHFMGQRHGMIVNVSSMLGFMGMFGYTAYAGSKFAIAGFTSSLRQELRPYNIQVSLFYPPTTKTEGLERENAIKPPEAWAIEGTSKTYPPDEVGRGLLKGVSRNKTEIVTGLGSWLIWMAQRLAPWMVRAVTDRVLIAHLAKQTRARNSLEP